MTLESNGDLQLSGPVSLTIGGWLPGMPTSYTGSLSLDLSSPNLLSTIDSSGAFRGDATSTLEIDAASAPEPASPRLLGANDRRVNSPTSPRPKGSLPIIVAQQASREPRGGSGVD
jgi:hypothetical protein